MLYNISVIVVTYNRKEWLKKNLTALTNQTYHINKIYVIDNASTDGSKEYVSSILDKNTNIDYLTLPENIGGAGGFYEGIKIAYNDGFDYIWGMDDDAVPKEDALEQLVKATNLYDKNEKVCFSSMTCMIDMNGKSTCNSLVKKKKDNISSWFTFVGFFLPFKLVEKIGFPRKDLFIFEDDREYSYRVNQEGYKIIMVKDSIIYHPVQYVKKNRLNVTKMYPYWRRYYMVRNRILIEKTKMKKDRHLLKRIIITHRHLLKVLIFDTKAFPEAFRGMVHGILGISGKRH